MVKSNDCWLGRFAPIAFSLCFCLVVPAARADDEPSGVGDESALAEQILAEADFTGGLIVHLGCGDARLTAALADGRGTVVHGLGTEKGQVDADREYLAGLGAYGRVSVDVFDGQQLPYADNLVNLMVVSGVGAEASGVGCQVSEDEIERVLCPGGLAVWLSPDTRNLTPETFIRKPRPDSIDDWTHFLYDASSNAVSRDQQVGPLARLQWDGGPRWSRSHETDMSLTAAVTAGGRLFHTIDDGPIGVHETPRQQRLLPDKCSLVARDAFNGIELWRRPMPNWGSASWDANRWRFGIGDQLWSAPLTLPRRLVTDGDKVYVTLGFRACVSELDAVTGETLREFPETLATEEFVVCQGGLVARTRGISDGNQQAVMAVDIESGATLWRKPVDAVADLTLAAADGRVCFHDTQKLIALDLRSGETLWQSEARPKARQGLTAGTLVMSQGVVLFAAPSAIEARRATDGELLWRKNTNTSFRGMPDVFAIGDMVWSGTLTTTGLDLLTGDVKCEIDPGHLYTGGHHVRCYRGKATESYLLWSKRGVEFVDLQADGHTRHDWVRGTCRYGILPANGLLYAPPHPCFCYPGVKITGFNALAPAGKPNAPAGGQLEQGPAFGEVEGRKSEHRKSADWPTYRHDNARSGRIAAQVPTQLQIAWSTKLQGKVSPPVLADGRLFVAEVDTHRVTCLDADKGERLWSYTAGGPVDSPPTIHGELVVFGCTDGCVYCLRATDGELVWRFRAVPQCRTIMSYERLESAWPVHGSVLIEGDVVYFAAGRSTYLDGGLYVYGLDAATGQVRYQRQLVGPDPDLTVPSNRAHEMDGSLNDILVSNGSKLFLTQNVFDLELNPVESPMTAKWGARATDRHLVATGGFLDDSGFDRLYWMYADRWPGLYVAHATSKAGQILVFDESTTYGLHTFNQKFGRSPYFAPGSEGYELFADDNDNEPILPDDAARRERGSMARTRPPKWSVKIPVRARAMVLTDSGLFLAGPPDVIDADDPYAAFEGREGGRLWAVSTSDGGKLAEYQLPTPPVFDGMIATQGRLYLVTLDGAVNCWK